MNQLRAAFEARMIGILDRASQRWPADLPLLVLLDQDHARRMAAGGPAPAATTGGRLAPGLTLPVLLGDAVRVARARLPDLAAELAAEVSRVAEALAPERAAELLAAEPADGSGPLVREWPLLDSVDWPTERERAVPGFHHPTDPERAAAATACALVASVDPDAGPVRADRLPLDVDREDLAAWAAPLLTRAGLLVWHVDAEKPPTPTIEWGRTLIWPIVGSSGRSRPGDPHFAGPRSILHTLVMSPGDHGRYPPRGLALVYRLTAGRRAAAGAARRAWTMARELLDVPPGEVPRGAVDAVRSALAAEPLAAELLGDPVRVAGLGAELLDVARAVVARVFDGDPPSEVDAVRTVAGPHGPGLAWDLALAEAVEGLGAGAAGPADEIREAAAGRARDLAAGGPEVDAWALWTGTRDGAPRWLRALAIGLWLARWRERETRKSRAVLHPEVLTEVLGSLRAEKPGPVYPDGSAFAVLSERGAELARISLDAHTATFPNYTPERLRRVLGSMTAHRWARFILPELQAEWYRAGHASTLVIEGGKAGIIDRMRAAGVGGSRADADVIADVIAALGQVEARTERTRGTLYSYEIPLKPEEWRTYAGRRAAPVKLIPGPLLDPARLFDDPSHRGIPLSRTFPPLQWTDRQFHASVSTLAIILVREIHADRLQVGQHGGVLWNGRTWTAFLNEVGISDPGPVLWERVRDALTREGRSDIGGHGEPVPPFLEVVERGPDGWRFTVSRDHAAVRLWIDQAAASAVAASRQGKASAHKREKRRSKA